MHAIKLVGHCFGPDQTSGSSALLESTGSDLGHQGDACGLLLLFECPFTAVVMYRVSYRL